MTTPTFQGAIIIQNPHGLHLRVASELVRLCRPFQAKVVLIRGDGVTADVSSPLALLTLEATCGTRLQVLAEGADAAQAGAAVVGYFSSTDVHAKE